jgi:PAS domain S-box-containing protein
LGVLLGNSKGKNFLSENYKEIFTLLIFIVTLTLIANKNYLLFHTVVDFSNIILGIVITIISYNTYRMSNNNFMGFLGIAYCFVAITVFIHILTDNQTNIIQSDIGGISICLWAISRLIQSISIIISFKYINKKLNFKYTFILYGIMTLSLIYIVFYTNIWPHSLGEQELNNLKRYSEYIVGLVFFVSLIMVKINKNYFEKNQYYLIFSAFAIDMTTSVIFTTYASIYGHLNIIGQILKVVSYYLIYKAIVKSNLQNPYTSLNLLNKELSDKIEELKESNERYTALVENTPNGILMHDNKKIIYANEEALRILNIEKKEDLIGRSPEEFNHPEYKEMIVERRENLLKYNKIKPHNEHVIIDNKGITKYIETTSTIIYENGNKRILTMFKDISERKYAEQQLKQSERTYSDLIELMPDGICILYNGNYVYANETMAKILNIKDKHDLIGEHKSKFSKTVPEYYESVFNKVNKSIKYKQTITYIEDRIIRHDGEILDLELSVMPFEVMGDGYILKIVRDVTERKKSESLKQKYNERVYYDKLKTEFFANMSHELKTPLNVIYGSSQLLQSQSKRNNLKEESIDKHTATINQNCFRLIRLINNIIDVTKMESGFYKIKKENHNIVSIVEGITLSITDYTGQKGIDLVFDTEIEEKIIAIDPDKIERVMLNLLSNAIKFTNENGQISVNIYDKKESIEISVKDTGVGIPEDKLDLIFDRFGQVDETIKINKEGSGIGLSLVKSIVEHHEGKISVKSELGCGSEFIITLPVIQLDEQVKEEEIIRTGNVESIHIEFSDIYA